jgi:hypothetical protein
VELDDAGGRDGRRSRARRASGTVPCDDHLLALDGSSVELDDVANVVVGAAYRPGGAVELDGQLEFAGVVGGPRDDIVAGRMGVWIARERPAGQAGVAHGSEQRSESQRAPARGGRFVGGFEDREPLGLPNQ